MRRRRQPRCPQMRSRQCDIKPEFSFLNRYLVENIACGFHVRCGGARPGDPMSKRQSHAAPAFASASAIPPRENRGGSGSAGRRPLQGEIGFVGLGQMGTAMAANLVASGRRVVAYVRRPDRIEKLEALGLRPTTDIGDLLDCELVISMLPDDGAVREVVFGRREIGLDGLAGGLMPGAIHLS